MKTSSAAAIQREDQPPVVAPDDHIAEDSVRRTALDLRNIIRQVTADEFRWQHAHYNHDSRYGRELLFLIANSGWIRSTCETVDITHSDAVDTAIKININLDQITHEAFYAAAPYIWLPLLVLPPAKNEEVQGENTGWAVRVRSRLHRPGGRHEHAVPQTGRPRLRSAPRQADTPDPVSTLTVSDATGGQIATVPDVDVLHWISAALAEIIVNMAAARWLPPPTRASPASAERRPVATRDQRLVLSAAIYRLLRSGPTDSSIAGVQSPARARAAGGAETSGSSEDEAGHPAAGRSGRTSGRGLIGARDQLNELLGDYVEHYEAQRRSEPIQTRAGSSEADLVKRAVQVLTAFTRYTVVVVPVHRDKAPTTLTVQVPTRPLTGKHWRTYGASRARLFIDVLMPSADADRQVQINLPDGIRFDSDPGISDLTIEVEAPQSLTHLEAIMSQLISDGTESYAHSCLADLAIIKASAADETLAHYLCGAVGQSADELKKQTKEKRKKLSTLITDLDNLSEHAERCEKADPEKKKDAEADLKKVRGLWKDGQWLAGPLQRRTSSDRPSPRTLVATAAMAEDTSKRAAPAEAWVQVDVGIAHDQFFSTALLAGTMGVMIMLLVLGFFLYSLVAHDGGPPPPIASAPSPEVLAAALTLFTAVQAARIEPADQSTLRGLLSGLGWLVIAASLMPTIVLAVAIAFFDSGWVPVWFAIAAIAVEILLQLDFQVLLRRARPRQVMGIPRRLQLQTIPLDYSGYSVLQSEWWRNTTADALKIGRAASAYMVWEKNSPSLLELIGEAWQSEPLLPRADDLASLASASEARPANILELLRAGTSDQALTFIIFREEPAQEWIEKWNAQPVELDPDRLAPTDSFTDVVELFVSIPRDREPPAFEHHPLGVVLAAAASCRLSVREMQLPVPSPLADRRGSTWARVLVGLHDGDIQVLAHFLSAVRRQAKGNADARPACSVMARTAPERRLRTILEVRPGPAANESSRVTASEIDIITASSEWQDHQGTASEKDWRVLALTANARIGIDHDILANFELRPEQEDSYPAAQQLRLAGLTYSVMHGIAVVLALGYQPRQNSDPRDWPVHFGELDATLRPRIVVDGWQSSEELGRPGADPLLRVRINAQDRPGTLIDVLKAVNKTVNAALREENRSLPDDNVIPWHALTRVTVGHETRLVARLKVSLKDVNSWDEGKLEEIERASRLYVATEAAARKSSGLLSGEIGAPEDTIISLSLIETPDD